MIMMKKTISLTKQQHIDNISHTIMLVDDSENLRAIIKEHLEIKGYIVWEYKNLHSAIKSFNNVPCALCIIDLSANASEKFLLLQYIRKCDRNIPVIILSDNDSRENRIRGFQLGCSDFLSKPFSLEELELRMRAILGRQHDANKSVLKKETIYELGNFTFNFSNMHLIHPKGIRTLTRKEAALLKLFCEYKNKLIPRNVILKEIWGSNDHFASRSLDVFITKLRSYLELDNTEYLVPKIKRKQKIKYVSGYEPLVEIRTIHSTGFMLKIKE